MNATTKPSITLSSALVLWFSLFGATRSSRADVRINGLFADHAVLQRDAKLGREAVRTETG